MTDLQMLGNSFCKFGLVSKYQRFSAAFWPKTLDPFENSLLNIVAQLHDCVQFISFELYI